VKQGEQRFQVETLSGRFKGSVFSISNNLMGKMEPPERASCPLP
jgi:hypothetical protein